MAITFDDINKIIEIESPATEVTVQELINAIRDWQDELVNLDIPNFASAAGKEDLGGGVSVGITMTLLNGWKVRFEARAGPDYVACRISGGNLVSSDGSIPYIGSAFVTVGLAASSAATSADSEAIQYSSYGNGVTIDVINGTAGTAYPIGTQEYPVDNLIDAQTIAASRGFTKLYIKGDLTIGATESINSYILFGEGFENSTITMTAGCTTAATEFNSCSVTGTQNGETHYVNCDILEISNVHCHFERCKIVGPIHLHPSAADTTHLVDCYSGVAGAGYPTMDFNDSPMNIAFRRYSGSLEITNCTDAAADFSFDLSSGRLILASSVTAGSFNIRGVGTLADSSNGATVNQIGLVNRELTTYDGTVFIDSVNGTAGTAFPVGTFSSPVDNMADAMIIATTQNINHLHFHSNMTITTGTDVSYMIIQSHHSFATTLTLDSGVVATDTIFENIKLTGVSPSVATYKNCWINSMTNLSGNAENCVLSGSNSISDGTSSRWHMNNCRSDSQTPAVLDVGDAMINCSGWTGMMQISGKDDAVQEVDIGMTWGYCIVDSSCTAGEIFIVGNGLHLDNSAGTTVNTDNLQTQEWYANATWDEPTANHGVVGSTGKDLEKTKKNAANAAALAAATFSK